MKAALRADGLVAGWGRQPLLRGLSLSAAPGDRVAVLGPNGAGKTTLFDVLAGRLRPAGGSIHLGADDVTRLPLHRRARLGLGYVPQEPSAFADLSVSENLRAALQAPARRPAPSAASDEDLLDAMLRRFALRPLAEQPARTLSGGERRRVEVARALLLRPAVLLLDEPFSGLDPRGRAALLAGLDGLPARTCLLVTDHAAHDLLPVCDRVVLLMDGGIAFDGPRADFAPSSDAWKRYFGP